MDKFYVGAKVVCVRSHPESIHVKGSIYTVRGVRSSQCSCPELEVDIGAQIPTDCVGSKQRCTICRGIIYTYNRICWCGANNFRPIEPDTELSETRSDEILDLINANE